MDITETDEDELVVVDALARDYLARYRNGDRPTVEEYASRHPELNKSIRRIFPLVLSVEKVKLDDQSESDGRATLAGRQLHRLGDFRLIREIGRGGMGIVYEAEQESLGRDVAVKLLPAQCLLDDASIGRFTREAKNAASMHHSNIVPVFGTGQTDGTHYIVMQLVCGESLDQRISDSDAGLPATIAATIARQVADALEYAHTANVLHRDIKPANILIDADGNALVTDFGLSRNMLDDPTETHALSGSLRYMAPERFKGVADQRGDVYALGLTLYEMLAGEPAFSAQDANQLIAAISQQTIAPLKKKRLDISADLLTIVEKAMHVDPPLRYQTAAALRDDLDRFLSDRPVLARRTSALSRLWRWSRRNPKLAGAICIAATAMLLASLVSTIAFVFTSRANHETAIALSQSEDTVNVALYSLDQTIEKLATPANSSNVGIEGVGASAFALEPSPRMASVLESILPLYERLAGQSPSRPDVLLQVTDASVRLAQIHRQLGRTAAAATILHESIARLNNRLPNVEIGPGISNRLYAQLYYELGQILQIELKVQEAEKALGRSVEFAQQLPESDVPGQIILATAHIALGTAQPQNGRSNRPDLLEVNQRTADLDAALEILERLENTGGIIHKVRILRSKAWLAKARLADRMPRRRHYTNLAIELLSNELENAPDDVAIRFALVEALASTNLRRLPHSGRLEQEATKNLIRARADLAPLRSRFPETQVFAVAEVHLLHKLSALSRIAGDFKTSKTQLEAAIQVQSKLVDNWPESFPHRCWRAMLYRSLAQLQFDLNNNDAAKQAIASATRDVEAISPDAAGHPFVIRTKRILADLQ